MDVRERVNVIRFQTVIFALIPLMFVLSCSEQPPEPQAKSVDEMTPEEEKKALLERGIQYRTETYFERVRRGDLEAVKLFFAAGMDVNQLDETGSMTALGYASSPERTPMARLLLAKGANVNAKFNYGSSPLHSAAASNNVELVKELISRGAEVNASLDNGVTPLMGASMHGHVKVVEELLAHGSEVNAADEERQTALIHAALGSHTETVKILLAHRAEIDAADDEGRTALILKAGGNDTETVKILLANNANVELADERGRDAYYYAEKGDNQEIIDLLNEARKVQGTEPTQGD